MRNVWKNILLGLCVLSALLSHAASPVTTAPVVPAVSPQTPAESVPAGTADAAPTCGPAPMRVEKQCEAGGAFLCLDTPPGGVTSAQVTIRGRVDVRSGTFAGLLISAQHDTTKQLIPVATDGIVSPDGMFEATVALPQLGSYTVAVQALRVDGAPHIETVALSRVMAPNVSQATMTVQPPPDAATGAAVGDHVSVTIDLLPQCEQCDLIGSSTGATTIILENTIRQGEQVRRIERRTNLGVDGLYQLCMPIDSGANHLVARVCSPATTTKASECPAMAPVVVQGHVANVAVHVQSPPPDRVTVFDAADAATIPLTFTVDGLPQTACDPAHAVVKVQWNHDEEMPLCPVGGVFHADLKPTPGVNLAIIRVRAGGDPIEVPVVLGWGKTHALADAIQNPAALWQADALSLGLSQHLLGMVVRPLLNHYLQSEQFDSLLQGLLDGGPAATEEPAQVTQKMARQNAIRATIPGCQVGSGPQDMRIQLVKSPQIGQVEVTEFRLDDHTIRLSVELREVKVLLRYFQDVDHDGHPDGSVLPLKIMFSALKLSPKIVLQSGNTPTVLLTADTTDCDFRDPRYCEKKPALLLPRNYRGSATDMGSFVVCDHEEQNISGDDLDGCKALNIVNMQTGLLSRQMLDAMNDTLYCTGSTALTDLAREGLAPLNLQLPPIADRHWSLPLQAKIDTTQSRISSRGIWARVMLNTTRGLGVGEAADYGYLSTPTPGAMPAELGALDVRDTSVNVAQDLVNQLLATAAIQPEQAGTGTVLDWDLEEGWLAKQGVDFSTCDGSDPSPLCPLRPRVAKLLGSALTTHDYFPPNQPLLLQIRGSRVLAPRVQFWRGDIPIPPAVEGAPSTSRAAQLIDLQIPDLTMTFFAIATDPHQPPDASGQPPLLYDKTGKPVIASLRPSSADPQQGYILRTHLTMMLTMEIGAVTLDPADPTQLRVPLYLVPSLTRFSFATAPADNNTLINPTTLLGSLLQTLQIGIGKFKRDEDGTGGFAIPLPKRLTFESLAAHTGLGDLGITGLAIDPDQFGFGIDPQQAYLSINTNLSFIQRLRVKGIYQEWTVPE